MLSSEHSRAGEVMRAMPFLFLVALPIACAGDRNGASQRARYGQVGDQSGVREPVEDGRRCPVRDDLFEESIDTSGDRVADLRKIYRVEEEDGHEQRKILVCREMDLNQDGRKDIFRFYSEEGRPMREMIDKDFDGQIDQVSFFEDGRVVRQELDRNHDGRPDTTRMYSRGVLLRIERDDNHDGQPDVWEHWDEGRLLRIGYDINNDQVADFWHRAPPQEDEFLATPTEPPEAGDEGAEKGEE